MPLGSLVLTSITAGSTENEAEEAVMGTISGAGGGDTPPGSTRAEAGRRPFARIAAALGGVAVLVTGATIAITDHATAATSSTTTAAGTTSASSSSGVTVTSAQSGTAVAQSGGS